jgi:glycosyltransferase involved in cell wall biosynthesis
MSAYSDQITFVVFTFNEERRIERVIKNFKRFGRVLVVDNESTDRTREIAAQYQCDVLLNQNMGWVEDEVTASRVKQTVKTEWIYWGFADEMVDQTTMGKILAAVHSNQCDIINLGKKNYYYGALCNGVAPDRVNRIFRKDAIDFAGNTIHAFGRVVPGMRVETLPLEYSVHHFISNTAKAYLQVMDRYTDTEVSEDRPPPNAFRLLGVTLKILLLNFIIRRGFRGGAPSLYLIANIAYYRWLSGMKQYERRFGLVREEIERKNDQYRDRILGSLE